MLVLQFTISECLYDAPKQEGINQNIKSLQVRTNSLEQSKEINQNLAEPKNFDIYFWVTFHR